MKDLLNKPRVFLSHSKKDAGFIKNIYDNLRQCQIEPWLDEFNIRHGEPWLDAIFENGIPTCDCVLVYLTENSITSPIVKKEIDASLIQKLKDNKISFLPYVSEESIRGSLRIDIQALQVPVWNTENYNKFFPKVVAEIWHSYLERTINIATNEEKKKRLELELQLEKNKDGDIFTFSENKDYEYIKKALDCGKLAGFIIKDKKTNAVKSVKMNVNILSMIPFISGSQYRHYDTRTVHDMLIECLVKDKIIPVLDNNIEVAEVTLIDISEELITFGLAEIQTVQRQTNSKFMSFYEQSRYVYMPKMYRFKYWLAYNNCCSKDITYGLLE